MGCGPMLLYNSNRCGWHILHAAACAVSNSDLHWLQWVDGHSACCLLLAALTQPWSMLQLLLYWSCHQATLRLLTAVLCEYVTMHL